MLTLPARVAIAFTLLLTSCSTSWSANAPQTAPVGEIIWKPKSYQAEKWLCVIRAQGTGRLTLYLSDAHVYQKAVSMSRMYKLNWLLEERIWHVEADLP